MRARTDEASEVQKKVRECVDILSILSTPGKLKHKLTCAQWRRNESESGRHAPEKNILVVPLHFLLALQVQLVVLVSAFVMVSIVWSVSCLLFFYSRTVPPCAQPFVKVGSTCPLAVTYGVGSTACAITSK